MSGIDPNGIEPDEGLPRVPVDDDVAAECEESRDELSPKQTADCAGVDLVGEFENEEDGGS